MIETQYITLNMVPSGVLPVLYCSQYDIGRPLGMVVYNGGEAVKLGDYTVTIEATRTDGAAITAAVTTDGNIGAFETTATMTNKADRYGAQLVLSAFGKRVASLPFVMCVVKAEMDENAESIEEDASLYQQYTETVQTLIADIRATINALDTDFSEETNERISADASLRSDLNAEITARTSADAELSESLTNEATARSNADDALSAQIAALRGSIGTPLVASTVSEMNDHSRIYVYTGSESGYASGHWYYWNGSAWTDGGVYQSSGLDTDTELVTWGAAADAKATGNGIKLLAQGYENAFFDIVKNSYPKNDGTFASYNNWNRTDLIPVEPNELIYINVLSNTNNNVWYKADRTPIASGMQLTLTAGLNTVRVPATAYYLCLSASASNWISSVYRVAKTLATKADVSETEKHIEQLGDGYESIGYSTIYGEYPKQTGEFSPYANWMRTNLIPVKPQEKLYFYIPARTTNNIWYDANQNPISSADKQFIVDASNPCILYVPREARYMCLSASTANWFTGIYRESDLVTSAETLDRKKLITGMSYGNYALEPGFAEKGAAFLNAMHNGITLDNGGANKFSHCPSLRIYNGFAYCVYQTDDVTAQEDAPTTKIQLAKINLFDMSVTYKDIAGRDVVSDMTFSGRCANPVTHLDETNGVLYILFNGMVGGVLTACIAIYNITADTFTTTVMTLVSTDLNGTHSVEFDRNTFLRYISDFNGVKDPVYEFVWSEPVTDGSVYYLALSSGGYKLGKTCLFSTTDFQTMTFMYTLPEECDADCECELAYFRNTLFGASRHRYTDCTLSVWKFDIATKNITDWIQIPDAVMRPTWYQFGGGLFLVHGLLHRYVLECLWVCYPDQLANSWHEYAVYVPEQCQYNAFAVNGSDLYCALMSTYKSEDERYSYVQIRFFKL